ncbi:Pao retrotransposon peptidase [Nesidiocoris tenuis]|uniref:Pao retrotransposon peptidase n=1 Tax=Nesidiocoris tenuis TaxID=355587 RepID=A0ABN7B0A9_9HEMI|nr:Pao retrotransposon peptidase [Nesidiocoris tenuis]
MNTNSYSPKKSIPPLAGSEYDDSRGRFSMARESEQFENKGALKEYDGTTRKTGDGEIWEADLVCKDFDSLPKSKEVTQNSPKRSLEQKLDGGPTLAASYCAKVEENGGIEAAEKPIHYQENSATTVQGTVLQKLKENVWILQARKAERDAGKAVSLCTWRKPSNNRTLAFSYVSLDYFGPLFTPVGRRRKKGKKKKYETNCIWSSTRAVLLEMVYDLSTDRAMMAARRIRTRRGSPKKIYSDNRRNFQELKRCLAEWNQNQMVSTLENLEIEWHFIPHQAPHMEGRGERLIRRNSQQSTPNSRIT